MTDEERGVGAGAGSAGADGTTDAGETDAADHPEGAKEGTFVVTHAEADTAVLKDADDGQVHTLSDNPGVEADHAVRGVVAPDPPMNVSWRLVEVDRTWHVTVGASDLEPTTQEKELAAAQSVGELTRTERAGEGELHVITVPADGAEAAVADVLDDEEGLRLRAARLGVNRVEVRSAEGVVSVRYVP
jgi:hypothetical protein